MTSADPLVLPSLPNFRDLGGVPARHGRRVRARTVFRSQGFERASAGDLNRLAGLGLRLVCDLRSPKESQALPNRWAQGHEPDRLDMGILTDLRAMQGGMRDYLAEHPTAHGMTQGMLDTYRNMPAAFAPAVPALFDRILGDDAKLPLVIHCHAGKDRTGFLCAVLLSALGVARDDIMADYLLSAERVEADRLGRELQGFLLPELGVELDEAALAPAVYVYPDYLNTAWAVLDRDYGGMEGYLSRVAGLDAARRERLQERLLA